jgi:hypothetical protein
MLCQIAANQNAINDHFAQKIRPLFRVERIAEKPPQAAASHGASPFGNFDAGGCNAKKTA